MIDKRDELISALEAIDPALCDYQTWTNVGMGIKAGGFDVDLWDSWSRRDGRRYHPGECEEKWDSFRDTGITLNTVFGLAYQNGWVSPIQWDGGPGGELAWDDEINDDYVVVNKGWLETEDFREPSDKDWKPVEDIRRYLSVLFSPEESVGYVIDAYQDKEKEKWHPNRSGNYDRTAGTLLEALGSAKSVKDVFFDYNEEAGVWIRFNPLDGQGVKNNNVTEYKYALVESDDMSLGAQIANIKELRLPVAALVYSGGKSVHAIVKIDAGTDYNEYRKRVDFLYSICEKNGLSIDKQNKNPSRLSRAPGFMRNGHKQFLIDTNIGEPSWEAWVEWIDGVNDDLPDIEDLDDEWEHMPDLAPELIGGILRQGHKMLVAGASKAGKSFLLIELAIAIAEGHTWLGRECAQGKVLYVNLELDKASCLHRFKDVYKATGIERKAGHNLKIWNLRGKSVPMDKLAPKLIRRCKKEKYIAVIIDPIYKVITGDENSAEQMSKFCNQFDKVATEMTCSVIYCHHHSKGVQGGKRSMDRASGSGVFARDPDALLDLIELELDDDVRKERLEQMEIDMALKWLPKSQTKDLTEEEKANHQKIMGMYWEHFRKMGSERTAEARLKGLKEKVEMMSAWRVDATLREFAKPTKTDIWFDYPVHYMDETGILKEVVPESDMTPQQIGTKRNASWKNKEKRSRKKNEELEIAFSSCEFEEIQDITIGDLSEKMGKSKDTVKRYIRDSKDFVMVSEPGQETTVRRKGNRNPAEI